MRRTKIVCTIGPATRSEEKVNRLIEAGMNVARLNFSHGSHEDHAKVIERIRAGAERAERSIAILQDLAGPKIRTGRMGSGPVHLSRGAEFILTNRDVPGDASEVSLTYDDLPHDVQAGDTLFLSDGSLKLHVKSTSDTDIVTKVVVGGPLGSHKGINLPNRPITAPILSEKDRTDLAFGLEQGVDFIALSFVRSAADVKEARAYIERSGSSPPIIAKIEKYEAVEELDEILENVEGIMVARGDLGVEIPLEQVPRIQKEIIRRTNLTGKPVITATQMLRSMVASPRPTRAESTDVANAILDGTDAVMLSEETAEGHYPIDAVETMSRIAVEAEKIFPHAEWSARPRKAGILPHDEAVADGACRMADAIGAAAIITCTWSGSTTRLVTKHRPAQRVLAMTPVKSTLRQLALTWGCIPIPMEVSESFELDSLSFDIARQGGYIRPGDNVVIVAGPPIREPGATDLIKIAKVV